MALKYVVTKQRFGFDPEKKDKFVVRHVSTGNVDFKKLCKQVEQICGAHRGTVQLVISGLIDALVNNLEDGKSVKLGDFGIFRSGIRAKAAETQEKATVNSIHRRRILFTPGKSLRDAMYNTGINLFSTPDVDYTDGSSRGGNDDASGGDGGFVDPVG